MAVTTLKETKLPGVLDMDVDVHVPSSAPAKSRLKGTVSTRNASFQLTSSNLAVAEGNLNLELIGSKEAKEVIELTNVMKRILDQALESESDGQSGVYLILGQKKGNKFFDLFS